MATDKSPKSTKPVDDDERDEREDDDEEEDVPAKKPAPKKAASKPAPRRARADEEDDDDADDEDDDDDDADDEDDDDEDDDDAPKSRNLTPVPRTPRKPRAFYIGAMAAGLAVVAYYAFKMNKNGKDDFWMHGVAVLGISLIVWGFMGIGSENEIDPETTSG